MHESGPIPSLGHQCQAQQAHPRPLPMPSLPHLLPTMGRPRPQGEPAPPTQTMFGRQDQVQAPIHGSDGCPEPCPPRPTRHALLLVPHGMARDRHRWTSPRPEDAHSQLVRGVRPSHRSHRLSPREDPNPVATCTATRLHAPGILDQREYPSPSRSQRTGGLHHLPDWQASPSGTYQRQTPFLRLVHLRIWRRRHTRPSTRGDHQADGSHMLPTPGLQPHQRDHVTSQTHPSRLSELSVIPGVQGLDPRRRTPNTPPFARAQRFNPGGDSSHAPTTLKNRILIPGGMDLMVTWNA